MVSGVESKLGHRISQPCFCEKRVIFLTFLTSGDLDFDLGFRPFELQIHPPVTSLSRNVRNNRGFSPPFVFESGARTSETDRQTDGRIKHVMCPIGRPYINRRLVG